MADCATIHPDLRAFVDFTRSRVSARDVRANMMNDPGIDDCFQRWDSIRQSGEIPTPVEVDFALSDCMAAVALAKAESDSERAFRRFNHAIALAIFALDREIGDFIALNYLCLNCIRDLIPGDAAYLTMVRNALAALRVSKPLGEDEVEYPFLLLAEVLLAQRAGDHSTAARLAGELIAADQQLRDWDSIVHDGWFLFGLTFFNSLHAAWQREIRDLKNPEGEPRLEKLIVLLG